MENKSSKDKYLEKKLAEAERENKPLLPKISMTDLALLGAIALFLIGSGLIWFMYPSMANYSKVIKSFMSSSSESDLSKDAIMISDEIKEKMRLKSLQNVDSELFEELSETDEEYVDPKSKTPMDVESRAESKLIEKNSISEQSNQSLPAFKIEPVPVEQPIDLDQENISDYVDPSQSGLKIKETGLEPTKETLEQKSALPKKNDDEQAPSQPAKTTQDPLK